MNILIITAHPSSLGFSHKVATRYKQGAEKKGHQVEILDLYKTNLKQGYLNFESAKVWPDDESRGALQEKLKWADEWVFAFPIWWGSEPAILKNFLDMNLTSGFAYRYVEGKPKKLLGGKSGRVFVTFDGPKWMYQLSQMPRLIWQMGILGFCGIKLKSFSLLSKKDRLNSKTLDKVERMGELTK